MSGEKSSINIGNTLPLLNIPVGTQVHCIEMKPGKGAQIARSAGTVAQIVALEGDYATLRLKSGETRKIFKTSVSNKLVRLETVSSIYKSTAKAGAKRWLGVRPTVRGVAMNPIDHPHVVVEKERLLVDRTLSHHGVHPPKDIKQDPTKELTN